MIIIGRFLEFLAILYSDLSLADKTSSEVFRKAYKSTMVLFLC
jgi:hypothetical protein